MKKILYVLLLVNISYLNTSGASFDKKVSVSKPLSREASLDEVAAAQQKFEALYKKYWPYGKLVFAIQEKNLPLIEYFINHNPELINNAFDRNAPLYAAASFETKNIFKRLLDAGAKFNKPYLKPCVGLEPMPWFLKSLQDEDIVSAEFILDEGYDITEDLKNHQSIKYIINKIDRLRNSHFRVVPSLDDEAVKLSLDVNRWLDCLQKVLNTGLVSSEAKRVGLNYALKYEDNDSVVLLLQASVQLDVIGTENVSRCQIIKEEIEHNKRVAELGHRLLTKTEEGVTSTAVPSAVTNIIGGYLGAEVAEEEQKKKAATKTANE